MTVISFPNGEKTETPAGDDKSGIETCLELATQRDLTEILVIGRRSDGDVWFSTNNGDGASMLFLLEMTKAIIIRECLNGEA